MKRRTIAITLAAIATVASIAADSNRSDDIYTALRTNDLARLKTLAQSGVDANIKDDHGMTPLMYAAAVGSVDAMTLLIDKGADVNAQNRVNRA